MPASLVFQGIINLFLIILVFFLLNLIIVVIVIQSTTYIPFRLLIPFINLINQIFYLRFCLFQHQSILVNHFLIIYVFE